MTVLRVIGRGTSDPSRTAAFFASLLDVEPDDDDGELRLRCSNGWLVVNANQDVPVALELAAASKMSEGADPDGLPVTAVTAVTAEQPGLGDVGVGVSLDHVAVTCADIQATMAFYRQLGMVCTWSARGDDAVVDGYQDEPVDGADWIHISGTDGYLSLSQADWNDFGVHNSASGPPRLIHIGLAVVDLSIVTRRLDHMGIDYWRAPTSAIGDRVYLNDPEGDPARGMNLELIQYATTEPRSGRFDPHR